MGRVPPPPPVQPRHPLAPRLTDGPAAWRAYRAQLEERDRAILRRALRETVILVAAACGFLASLAVLSFG